MVAIEPNGKINRHFSPNPPTTTQPNTTPPQPIKLDHPITKPKSNPNQNSNPSPLQKVNTIMKPIKPKSNTIVKTHHHHHQANLDFYPKIERKKIDLTTTAKIIDPTTHKNPTTHNATPLAQQPPPNKFANPYPLKRRLHNLGLKFPISSLEALTFASCRAYLLYICVIE